MKYYCIGINECVGEYESTHVLRIKAPNDIGADHHMRYWLAHWCTEFGEDTLPIAVLPDETGTYYFNGGEVSVKADFTKEISEATYQELAGIIPDMSLLKGELDEMQRSLEIAA